MTLTDSIIDLVVGLVRDGELQPGDRVPTEHELSSRLGVGRTSVREALKALQVMGLIVRRQDGTYVADEVPDSLLDRIIESGLLLKRLELSHLFQARRIVEGEVAALAATRIDSRTLGHLEELCEQMEGVRDDIFEEFFALDMRFHLAIAEVVGNPVLTRMWSVIHELLEGARAEISSTPRIKAQSNENHRRLLDAFRRRDPGSARETIVDSLTVIEELIGRAIAEARDSD